MATDAEIRAAGLYAVPKREYLQNEFQLPTEEVVEETGGGIPQTQAFTNSGDNNFSGSTSNLGRDFQQAVDARQARLNDTSLNKNFLGFPSYRQGVTGADAGEYVGNNMDIPTQETFMGKVQNFMSPQSAKDIMTDGYREPRFQPGIIGTMMGKLDNFRNLPQADQAFIAQNMGYTGPTVFGENNSGLGKDMYGINIRSMFGNYADYVDKMEAEYDDIDEAAYNKLSKFQQKKIDFYRGKKKESDVLKMQKELEEEERKADIEKIQDRIDNTPYNQGANLAGGGGGNTATHDFGTGKGPQTAQEAAHDNDPNTGSAQGHNQHYAEGGRIGYFFGGRARLQGGGMSQGNESNISQSTNMGGGATGDFSTGEQTMNHNIAIRNATKKTTPVKDIIDTGSDLNYLNNLKNLNLPGIVLGLGVNKFRNYLDNKKTKEEDDKLSYNNTLPTNNYFAEVKQKDLDASKMKGFKQQDYPSYKDQMEMLGGTTVSPYEFKGLQDGTITTTGTFTAANGGRAMFKNGGLASIL